LHDQQHRYGTDNLKKLPHGGKIFIMEVQDKNEMFAVLK
jgi:hypothetical protein